MRITYLYHSGFVVEHAGMALVFDYWRDTAGPGVGYLHREVLPRVERLYVFASHFHADHFNPDVLAWQTAGASPVFLFGKDVLRRRRARKEQAYFLAKGDTYCDDSLFVRAHGSTDSGVSFEVRWNGCTLFHAGDLNNWHWRDESTEKESLRYEKMFLGELKDLRKHMAERMDMAFFPVDARLGSDYMRGARQFVETFRPQLFIPMHFTASGFTSVLPFASVCEAGGCAFWPIAYEGESYEVSPGSVMPVSDNMRP